MPTSSAFSDRPELRPVIRGFDIPTYAFARLFHEQFGSRSITLSATSRGPIAHSKILDNVFVTADAQSFQDELYRSLERIANENAGKTLIYQAFNDKHVDDAIENRAFFDEHGYILPFASTESLRRAASKAEVARMLTSLGLPTVAEVEVDTSDEATWDHALGAISFPAVLKPRDGGTILGQLTFPGYQKVYKVDSSEEARKILELWASNDVSATMLLQEFIVGDDTATWYIGGYINGSGQITALGSAQQVVGYHNPDLIGNAGMLHVRDNPELQEATAELIKSLGLRGCFAVDAKVDERTGTAYIIDVNPRFGRASYYLNLGGVNLAKHIVADFVDQVELPLERTKGEGLYSIFPTSTIKNWVADPGYRDHLKRLIKDKGAVHPLKYEADRHPYRTFYRLASGQKLIKDLKTYYPTPRSDAF